MSSPNSYQSISVTHPPDEETLLLISEESESIGFAPTFVSKMKKYSVAAAFLCAGCAVVLAVAGVLPQSMSILRSRHLGAGEIYVCAKEYHLVTPRPSVGAYVRCVDLDSTSDNDFMGHGDTGSDGCITIQYDKNEWWDSWLLGSNPDILCTVSKTGYVSASPPAHNDANVQATQVFNAKLYRDRVKLGDYGDTNLCGPAKGKGWFNEAISGIIGFGDVCNNHDKCYYDCQILAAVGGVYQKGAKFCDDEMLYEMQSLCHKNHGHVTSGAFGTGGCLGAASLTISFLRSDNGYYYEQGLKEGEFSCAGSINKSNQNHYA